MRTSNSYLWVANCYFVNEIRGFCQTHSAVAEEEGPALHATCPWRIVTFSIISDSWQLLLPPLDITLGEHEGRHLSAFSPIHLRCKATSARRWPLCHRREPAPETATDYPQPVSTNLTLGHPPPTPYITPSQSSRRVRRVVLELPPPAWPPFAPDLVQGLTVSFEVVL